MNRILLTALFVCSGALAMAQNLAPDQNPNFAHSRDKYMKLADSLNSYQSTTAQNTYKPIDYLADKAEAREERREFRQQRRLERARWNNYDNWNWNNRYYDDYYFRGNRFNNNFYRPYRNSWNNPVTWGTVGSPFFWYWMFR